MPTSSIPLLRGLGRPKTNTDGHDPDPGVFDQLVALYQSNAVLLDELRALRKQLRDVRHYRESQGAHQLLADSWILRLWARQASASLLLRSNRVKAHSILGRIVEVSDCA